MEQFAGKMAIKIVAVYGDEIYQGVALGKLDVISRFKTSFDNEVETGIEILVLSGNP